MDPYVVQITRTESIAFEIYAASPEDAENRIFTDGREIASSTLSVTVDSVDQGTAGDILG